jgi:hypothetical protein
VIPSGGTAPRAAALPGSLQRNDKIYQIILGSKPNNDFNNLTPWNTASNPPNVLFHSNGNFGNTMCFHF